MNRTRTEALSDGVFAVAATLLVFSVQVPDVRSGLGQALLNQWPAYAAYVISFATILVIWVNHHTVLDNIKTFDGPLMYLNGLLLMIVAVIPFPTFLVAKYFVAGHDESAAAFAYGVVLSLVSLSFTSINLYVRSRSLHHTPFNFGRYSIGQLLYPLGVVVSLLNARAALAIYAAMVAYYAGYPLFRASVIKGSSVRG